ncbi:MAG TPA: RtcB family protein [Candidatus Eisenbacteria bacterium]|jgi:glycosyltransferase involved in cell wall biosynthesis/O-antigen/teichoic acid export membrane protein/RNA-splicing ligase RtcB
MRIVDVIHLSSSANTLLKERVLAMRARGHDNRIVCANGPAVSALRAAGIPVHTVDLPRTLDPIRLLVSLVRLTRLFRRERVDLIHTHCSIPGVVGRLAARLAGVPAVVHTVHGFHFHDGMPAWTQALFTAIERWCGRHTSLLLTQNHSDLQCAVAREIGRPGRRRWIGNGIDLSKFDPARREPAGARVVVTCVARFEPVKNHGQLLEAAAILARRGAPFELWLVGEGPRRERCEAEARALGLAGVVRFLGYREDVPALLARTQIAVLPSVKEGIPRALIEAMAMGLPVVATRVKGNDEVVRHGEDGFLVPLGDVHALAATLAVLVDDAALRERLGRNGRQRALDEFDESEIVRRLGELYAGLAPSEPAGARPAAPVAGPIAEAGEVGAGAGAVPDPAVARNALFRLGAQVVSAAINVAAMVLLGRALGAARYGEYAYLYAFIPLIASACDLGAGMMITREIARCPADGPRLLGAGILIKCAVLVLLLLCVTVLVPALSGSAGAALMLVIVIAATLDPGQDPAAWVLRAHARSDLESMLLVASQGLWLAAIAVGVARHAGVTVLLAATLLAYVVRVALGAGLVFRRWGAPVLRIEPARLRALVAQGAPYGAAMLCIVLYGRVGLMMLKALATSRDVAHFQIAYLLSQPLGFIASALALAAFPALAREGRDEPAAAARRVRGLVRLLLGVSLPLAVALMLLAEPIVGLLFAGRDYRPAASALRLVAPALPLIFMNLLARYVLAAFSQQRWYLGAVLAGVGVNVLLCSWWIPGYGLAGACAAYVGAELVVFAVCQHALRRRIAFGGVASDAVRPLLAAAGMGVAVAALGPAPAVPVAAVLGAGTYAASLGFLSVLRPNRLRHGPQARAALEMPSARHAHAAAIACDGDASVGKLVVLGTRGSEPGAAARLGEIAALPCVESVLALPDLHWKPQMETASSLAITTVGAVVPEFTSVAVNDGMGLIVTDLELSDLTPERLTRLFARINSHAAAHPLDANRYSLSAPDLALALTEGAHVAVRRYGLEPGVLERMEGCGRFPLRVPPGELGAIVPRVLQRSRAFRSEMGLNFGGNHFLEAQVVDRVLEPAIAREWGLSDRRVVFMYHLGPGPFSGTLLHHYTRREKLPRTRAAALFGSKLAFHYLQRFGRGRTAGKWPTHFRRNRWTVLPEASEEAVLFEQALALATNFGFVYRLATVAAVRDALDEVLGARARLLCDVSHNGIAPESVDGRERWVARHNACRLAPSRPAIVAGAHDVVSYLARGAAAPPAHLHTYDHGAGHLIERSRHHRPPVESRERSLRLVMARGRRGGLRLRETPPLARPEPIEELMACLEKLGMLEPAVRLRPLATLKN